MEANGNIAINPTDPLPTLQSVGQVVSAPEPKKTHGLLRMPSAAAAEMVGIGFAVVSAGIAAVNTVRINFYRNMDKYKVFHAIKEKRDESYKTLYRESEGRGDASHLIKSMQEVEKEYTAEVDKLFKGYGIKSVSDRWKTLKYHQKNDALLAFGAVSAILLGMVAGTAATRRVEEQQEGLKEKLDEVSKKIDQKMNQQSEISR